LLYLGSIIRNFAKILNVKVLTINAPPEENELDSKDILDDSIEKNLVPDETKEDSDEDVKEGDEKA
jgi:hypothetical protein